MWENKKRKGKKPIKPHETDIKVSSPAGELAQEPLMLDCNPKPRVICDNKEIRTSWPVLGVTNQL